MQIYTVDVCMSIASRDRPQERRPGTTTGKVMQTFRIPRELVTFLKQDAARTGRDLTAYVNRMLDGLRTYFGLPLAATQLLEAYREALKMQRCESVAKEGKVTVPARNLFEIVPAAPRLPEESGATREAPRVRRCERWREEEAVRALLSNRCGRTGRQGLSGETREQLMQSGRLAGSAPGFGLK